MSKRKEFNKKVVIVKCIIILFIGAVLGASCLFSKPIEQALGIGEKEGSFVDGSVIEKDDLTVHYIDVGQGDSTLICLPDGKVMLIDAAEASEADRIVNYVNELDIETIDYFIVTHSDSDHSGGAKKILETFEVKSIYRPFQIAVDDGVPIEKEDLAIYYNSVYSGNIASVDTKTYSNFITAAYNETYNDGGSVKKAEVVVSHDSDVITSTNESDFTFTFYAPLIRDSVAIESKVSNTKGFPTKYYSDNNDNSPVMVLDYNETTFFFSGDATKTVEEDVINSLTAVEKELISNIDVYKAAHHGSQTSNGKTLLDAITPNYVVISSGNEYGHPHDEVLARIDTYNHEAKDYLLRTDSIGNIMFGFDKEGKLCYTAVKEGVGGVTIYWWYIALGAFVCLSIVVISVKVTTNKTATAKRFVSKTKKVAKRMRNN